jgi:hypothetical protein
LVPCVFVPILGIVAHNNAALMHFHTGSVKIFIRSWLPRPVSCTPHGGQGGAEAACGRDMATGAEVCRLNPCGFDMFSRRGPRPCVSGRCGVVLGRALTVAVKPVFHGNRERGDL